MSLGFTIYAADGSVWDLSHGPVRITKSGIGALLLAGLEESTSVTSGTEEIGRAHV